MITLSKQHADWDSSRKIRIGDKWLLGFWFLIYDDRPTPETEQPYSEEDQSRFTRLWNSWIAIPRIPLARGRVGTLSAPNIEPVYLQEFTTESGEQFYLMQSVLDYLPDKQLSYWHSEASHLILVTDGDEVLAVFAQCIPNGTVEYES